MDREMTRFERLRKEALEACQWRGHTMRLSRHTVLGRRVRGTWYCTVCDASMAVDTHPDPNGIDIIGDAVAVECQECPPDEDSLEDPEWKG